MAALHLFTHPPEAMETDALFWESMDIAALISRKKETMAHVQRFHQLLTELAFQRIPDNLRGAALTKDQQAILQKWYGLLSTKMTEAKSS